MLKRISAVVLSFLLAFSFLAAYAEDKANQPGKIEQKLAGMKIKNYTVKDNFSKMIYKLYLFNDNNLRGGVALSKLDEYNVYFYIVVLKYKDYSLIKYVEVMDENALADKKRMKELIDGLAAMNEMKLENVSDAITGATQYSKKVFLQVKIVAMQVVRALEAEK